MSSDLALRRGAVASVAVTKDAIFACFQGVLHDPVYPEKYALNLKREFPRIPFLPQLCAVGGVG